MDNLKELQLEDFIKTLIDFGVDVDKMISNEERKEKSSTDTTLTSSRNVLDTINDSNYITEKKSNFKLVDVMDRLRAFQSSTRNEWVGKIVSEFGKHIPNRDKLSGDGKYFVGYHEGREKVLEELRPKIPERIAEIVDRNKLHFGILEFLSDFDIEEWAWINDNQEKFVKAWLFGYEVQEPKYRVTSQLTGQKLIHIFDNYVFYQNQEDDSEYKDTFTREELVKLGIPKDLLHTNYQLIVEEVYE